MIERCYDEKFQIRNPTYIGCTVCDEWHNFQNFAIWMSNQDHEGKQLDKDINSKSDKRYGPDTCLFVSCQENNQKAHSKMYTFVSPLGVVTEIYNLRDFCRENELQPPSMVAVNNGKRNHHKGWTKH